MEVGTWKSGITSHLRNVGVEIRKWETERGTERPCKGHKGEEGRSRDLYIYIYVSLMVANEILLAEVVCMRNLPIAVLGNWEFPSSP